MTLRGAIDWSWNLLRPFEQVALAQCSVFRDGFLLEAAESVIDLGAFPDAPMVMDVVESLVEKSLLRAHEPA
jgi:predicted ATPase